MLVSVIIPTHNRARYALPTIRSVLETSTEIEVVVTDTSEADELSLPLQGHPGAARLKLLRPGRPLSVVENFELGLRAAQGRYLAFIGDDDLVAPQIVDLARWAESHDVDALRLSFAALYHWPDFMHKRHGDALAGTLMMTPYSGHVSAEQPRQAMQAAARDLGGGVGTMPRAYAGMISKRLAQDIVAKYGSLFGGVSPDIYSAVLIATESQHCVFVDFPIIVPGASGASTAGQSANGRHVGGLRDNAHIGAFRNLVWDPRIPEFYSVPTVWSYSLCKALERVNALSLANFERLYVRCLLYHRPYRAHTLAAIREHRSHSGWLHLLAGLLRASISEAGWIAGKLRSMLVQRARPGHVRVVRQLQNTAAAAAALGSLLDVSALERGLQGYSATARPRTAVQAR
jgi:hypothetical protein